MKNVVKIIFAILLSLSSQIQFAQKKIEFKPMADMNSVRYGMGYTFDGKYIYAICGGTVDSNKYLSNTIECYDIESDKWTIIAKDLNYRRYCNAEYIPSENKIYIFNGENIVSLNKINSFDGRTNIPQSMVPTQNVEIVDLNSKQVVAGSCNPYPVVNAGSAVWNNKIYVFGGSSLSTFIGSSSPLYWNYLCEYDPVKDTWNRLPDMPEAKQTKGKIIDGVLYIFGGYDGNENRNIDAYNISESTWTHIGTLPAGVSANAVASDGRNIWLVGSYNNLKYLAVFDPKSKTVTTIESNITERRNAAAQIVGDYLYVFGGNQKKANKSALLKTECANISLFWK